MTNNIINKARDIAREAHKGYQRKDGTPYINHPQAVAMLLETDDEKIVAWLHDVLEDTNITFGDLVNEGIPKRLCEVIDLLTRIKGENYLDEILRIKENDLAIRVKIADLMHNLSNLENGSLRDKYLLALYILKEK